jgi:Zn-dependent peptidase ImmA (M78 family)/DNA-binding XRE family transcriptional regulator
MNSRADFVRMLGERVRHARLAAELSQDELARRLGFNDRQTISTIETGQRAVSAEELVALTIALKQPLDFFTDPYVVTEKHALSYRAKTQATADVPAFERQAERLIASQRRFRELLGEPVNPIMAQLGSLTKQSPLDFATFLGERTTRAWQLGDIPAVRLRESIERELRATILFIDAPASISGAACRLQDGDFIFINRNEPLSRQNFDLGHELFHLLTWEKMQPERLDLPGARTPIERLANSFTAGLLMPAEIVKSRWQKRGTESLATWIGRHASELRVSPEALYWRLVNLELITKEETDPKALPQARDKTAESRPNLYSAEFVARLHKVLARGLVSVLRTTELLDCSIDDLKGIFRAYKLQSPFEL